MATGSAASCNGLCRTVKEGKDTRLVATCVNIYGTFALPLYQLRIGVWRALRSPTTSDARPGTCETWTDAGWRHQDRICCITTPLEPKETWHRKKRALCWSSAAGRPLPSTLVTPPTFASFRRSHQPCCAPHFPANFFSHLYLRLHASIPPLSTTIYSRSHQLLQPSSQLSIML